jgi:selenide,water dikinase
VNAGRAKAQLSDLIGRMVAPHPRPRLTSLSHGAGCGCKLPASPLRQVLAALPAAVDPRLMVGHRTVDDAAVYLLRDDLALIQTVDFFTPVVDDAYDFGRIAAANAISDVYAMGGEPLLALNLVAFPLETLGGEVLTEILRGGQAIAAEAGIPIPGGHSIDDAEPKYGLAVTGIAPPDRVLTNAGARAGDALVLTKPLGAGAIVTAAKRGLAVDGLLDAAVDVMATLNRDASRAALDAGATAATDVTGFALLGHLHELCAASGLAARVSAGAVPAITGTLELLEDDGAVSGGSRGNRAWAEGFTDFDAAVPEPMRRLLCDATTSGGLLVALPPDVADALGHPVVGRLELGQAGSISVGP